MVTNKGSKHNRQVCESRKRKGESRLRRCSRGRVEWKTGIDEMTSLEIKVETKARIDGGGVELIAMVERR